MDEKKSKLEDTYHIAGLVKEVFMEVCRLELATYLAQGCTD
jgi:hypothetical protein